MMSVKFFVVATLVFGSFSLLANTIETNVSNQTQNFKKDDWGVHLVKGTSSLKIGGRLQGVGAFNTNSGDNDLFLRRGRVNLQYELQNGHRFYMDLRNDKVNLSDSGEGDLQIGDGFYEIPVKGSDVIKNVRLFRAKVDVSYTQTASSKNILSPARANAAEYAANYIVHNRRANNIQMNGGGKRYTFQLAIADGVQSDKVDAVNSDVSIDSISKQKLTMGGKFRYYIWGDKAPLQETFYQGKNTLSVGVGAFHNDGITFELSDGDSFTSDRQLYNVEVSYSYRNFRFLTEGFVFAGDLVNLDERESGTSTGYYTSSEMIFGKVAPFVSYSNLDRDRKRSEMTEHTYTAGVNYYVAGKSQRYGVSFTNRQFGAELNESEDSEINLYTMLDY